MFYKKCDKCTNRTCEKTGKICDSMDAWLKKYVEVPQAHKIMSKAELEMYENLSQGVDNKEDME